MVRAGWGRVIFISSESALQIPAEMIHYEKALFQLRESTFELLTRSQPPEKARELAGLLATGT